MARKKNVIAPNNTKAVVAMDKMAAEIEKARELYGDGQPYEEERILDCIVFKYHRSVYEIEMMGKYCHWYRIESGHGRFLEGLKRRNVDVRDAYYAMAMVEKFGDKFGMLPNLGIGKARLLTRFSKEEIDTYAQGGPLGDIPHDDVANMTTRELEAEIRKLREKLKKTETVAKERIRQKDEQITSMEFEIERGSPLSEKEKAEKAINFQLEELREKLFAEIHLTRFHCDECLKVINAAQKIEGVTFPMLEKWAKEEYAELADFGPMLETLDEALQYVNPDKGGGDED
jgi:hypothetical protein